MKTVRSSYPSGSYEEAVIEIYINNAGCTNLTPWNSTEIIVDSQPANRVSSDGNDSIYSPFTDPTTEYGVTNEPFSRTQALFRHVPPSITTLSNRNAQPWKGIRALW
jgi:hypothetical protein